ncbi:MAG: nucleotidyltransferase family protein [Candidatus Nanoarchaeia archaeon]|jgi:hypothetical protein
MISDKQLIDTFTGNRKIKSSELVSYIKIFCKQDMEYQFLKRIDSKNKIATNLLRILDKRFDDNIKKFKRVVNSLNANNVDFVLVKSNPPFKSFSNDFDLIIADNKDYLKAINLLEKQNYLIGRRPHKESHCYSGDFMVDVHNLLGWDGFGFGGGGFKLLDEGKIMRNAVNTNFFGINLKVPKVEDEVLILMAHSLFQHHYLSFYEFNYLYKLFEKNKIDVGYIKQESSRFGWWGGAKYLLSLVNSKYKFLSDKHILSKEFSINYNKLRLVDYNPMTVVLHLYVNKFFSSPSLSNMYNSVTGFLVNLMRFLRYKYNGYLAFNIDFLSKDGLLQ